MQGTHHRQDLSQGQPYARAPKRKQAQQQMQSHVSWQTKWTAIWAACVADIKGFCAKSRLLQLLMLDVPIGTPTPPARFSGHAHTQDLAGCWCGARLTCVVIVASLEGCLQRLIVGVASVQVCQYFICLSNHPSVIIPRISLHDIIAYMKAG